MNFSSAFELKHQVLTHVVPQSLGAMINAPGLGVRARSMTEFGGSLDKLRLGLAIGICAGKSSQDFRIAVRVQSQSLLKSPVIEAILREAHDEADIRYTGTVRALSGHGGLWFRTRRRPLEIGISVAHQDVTAGTLGAFVRKGIDQHLYILSNNHVLANGNRGRRGDVILQPGVFDCGERPHDIVARLTSYKRISFTKANLVDAAVARLEDGIEAVAGVVHGIGEITGVLDTWPELDSPVEKLGRTTGHSHGTITAIAVDDVFVEMGSGRVAAFNEQIEIQSDRAREPFSQGGDSGSLILAAGGLALGLLFAGSDHGGNHNLGMTYANRLDTVLAKLGVTLVTA